jgi:hypothetical protein
MWVMMSYRPPKPTARRSPTPSSNPPSLIKADLLRRLALNSGDEDGDVSLSDYLFVGQSTISSVGGGPPAGGITTRGAASQARAPLLAEIQAVPPLVPPIPRTPVLFQDNLLHPSGLWDVTQPDIHIACRSVFKQLGWVQRHLTPTDFLQAYNMPLGMDVTLSVDKHAHDILVLGYFPSHCHIHTEIHVGRGQWGGRGDKSERQEDISPVPMDLLAMEVDGRREVLNRSVPKEVKVEGIENGLAKGMVTLKSNTLKCRGSLGS